MEQSYKKKLEVLNNSYIIKRVKEAIELCQPEKVTVITDDPTEIQYLRELALKNKEEEELKLPGHTVHFDGYYDQGRDKGNTRYLLSHKVDWGIAVNSIDKEEGLTEIKSYFQGSMKGKEMLILFFSLGPTNSSFSIPALQITDSAYVAHSEEILYRHNYEGFKELKGTNQFFYFLHSAGRLKDNVSVDLDKRRVYIDLEENCVYSVNYQYAGNSVGLKKLAFRLAIQKAHQEGWLAEHMFIMGVHGKKNRTTYFTGAFPSACGKTSTAMLPGQTIVGDDIAYLKKINGEVKAVNVEKGIFGIITDVNPKDDPVIYQALTSPREIIFSNVLVKDGIPYWLGMGRDLPQEGINYSGKWYQGKRDKEGNLIDPAHKNARYTIRLAELKNIDPEAENPKGVPVDGFLYGGRDSDTTLPVVESLSWEHGVFLGATLESETTAATLGKQGVRRHDPMANLDFISVPFAIYLENYLSFQKGLTRAPKIFATNYFLKNEQGLFLNDKMDKKVWIIWAEGRVHDEWEAVETPVGKIPFYEDLKYLFKRELNKDYSQEEYVAQFSLRVDKYLAKMDRMKVVFAATNIPVLLVRELEQQIERLNKTKEKFEQTLLSPLVFHSK
ncbi:MAG: Phosphoenolpyruvate carboxykinase [candidate division TA06 bacterium 34_109]|uniref:Phosphoenolpyruvate carboxykinase [GTP] n=1 Tax=candidate division TA06 bacterium 34_109 TaxID=1635277 RepID=A0A117M626_UNCT6|nr:MAG: Phosphoenolpyruvate carboxykinase [candidate division TA06 bacterium 34_109]